MSETCADCRFMGTHIKPAAAFGVPETTTYWCRRYPPSIQSTNKGVYFTPVDPESWCGEHQTTTPAQKDEG